METTTHLIRKYYDRIGRIVTVLKDTLTHKYTIKLQLYDKHGESMLVDSNGCSVTMLCYTFPNRKSCFQELSNKYKRETKIMKE